MEILNTTSTTDPLNMYNYLNTFVMKPVVFVIILVIIVFFIIFSSSLSKNSGIGIGLEDSSEFSLIGDNFGSNGNSSGSASKIIGTFIIVIIFILLLVNALQYFFSINITAYVKNLFQPNTQLAIEVNNQTNLDNLNQEPAPIPEIRYKNQVFNIPGNKYNYSDAKTLCKAYGADLATYEQIEEAYNKGAEWCNYGWSAEQLALFPTQQKTYNYLQTIDGHKNDCGRPGINGGFIANPNIKFGVNCFGHKPKMTPDEEELMKNTTPYPQNEKDILFQKKVDYWKGLVDQILVSPFNSNNWSQ